VRRILSPSSGVAGLALLGLALLSPRAAWTAHQRTQPKGTATVEWKTYGADLASTRYSPLDEIGKANFSKLKIAWRLTTNDFGPRPDTLYSSTSKPKGREARTPHAAARGAVSRTGPPRTDPISASST
jgi:hypothetical protein